MKKHMIYAEDIIQELMSYPDNSIHKYELRRLVDKVVAEKEITRPIRYFSGASQFDEGDIYD